jgi:hypothetical protein
MLESWLRREKNYICHVFVNRDDANKLSQFIYLCHVAVAPDPYAFWTCVGAFSGALGVGKVGESRRQAE